MKYYDNKFVNRSNTPKKLKNIYFIYASNDDNVKFIFQTLEGKRAIQIQSNLTKVGACPYNKILGRTKLKACEDNKLNIVEMINSPYYSIKKNNVGIGENAGYQQFIVFQQCFQNCNLKFNSLLQNPNLSLRKEAFKYILRKGENAGNHFQNVFYLPPKKTQVLGCIYFVICKGFVMSSAKYILLKIC